MDGSTSTLVLVAHPGWVIKGWSSSLNSPRERGFDWVSRS